NIVSLETVRNSHGERPVVDGDSLGIGSGDPIGDEGLNGGGTTALLEVGKGTDTPKDGGTSPAAARRMDLVTQRTELPAGATVRNVVLDAHGYEAEHEWAADAKVRSVLSGLGIARLGLDTTVDHLSGGERRRVALAAALVRDLDLIVLD